ncbi:hypothetical protein [Actinomadura rifamycini]|uniref:hypothetical protein n=1 Tax=Actinomadura rifamycini TaxID=31962 RepID=UPI0012FC3BAA|nr:hypothetical protein [Actinomadura rifamycini]
MTSERAGSPDTRKHLVALMDILQARHLLMGGIIRRMHALTLRVVRVGQVPRPTVEVVVVSAEDGQWFARYLPNGDEIGEKIGLVDDPSGVATAIEWELRDRAEATAGRQR